MATCSILFLVVIGMPFLVARVSCERKLYESVLNQDERQACPNVNCAGKPSCSIPAQCSPHKCCIDLINDSTCCFETGDPTHATTTPTTASPTTSTTTTIPTTTPTAESPTTIPTTTIPTTAPTTAKSTPNSKVFPSCNGYTLITDSTKCNGDYRNCLCKKQEDCWYDEICCVYEVLPAGSQKYELRCYLLTPPPTKPPVGARCPGNPPDLNCSKFQPPGRCDLGEITCQTNEICCKFERNGPACCVVPPI